MKVYRRTTLTAFFAGHTVSQSLPTRCTGTKAQKKEIKDYHAGIDKSRYNRWQSWKGYLFMATNNFKEYTVVTMITRVIERNVTYDVYVKPGEVIATATVDDQSALTHIEVNSAFRRQKIGTTLIQFMKNACRNTHFTVYTGVEHNSRYRLTEQGAHLISHCRRVGILKAEHIIHGVPQSPNPSY